MALDLAGGIFSTRKVDFSFCEKSIFIRNGYSRWMKTNLIPSLRNKINYIFLMQMWCRKLESFPTETTIFFYHITSVYLLLSCVEYLPGYCFLHCVCLNMTNQIEWLCDLVELYIGYIKASMSQHEFARWAAFRYTDRVPTHLTCVTHSCGMTMKTGISKPRAGKDIIIRILGERKWAARSAPDHEVSVPNRLERANSIYIARLPLLLVRVSKMGREWGAELKGMIRNCARSLAGDI